MTQKLPACRQCGGPVRGKGSPFCSRKCFGISRRVPLLDADLIERVKSGVNSLHELSRQFGFDKKTINKKLNQLGISIQHKTPLKTVTCSECSIVFEIKISSRNAKCKACMKAVAAEKKRLRTRQWVLDNPIEAKQRKKEFYERHKEKIIKLQTQYRKANPELYKKTAKRRVDLKRDYITEYRRDYYLKNADSCRKKSAKWVKENPDRAKINNRNSTIMRRYRTANGRYSLADVSALFKSQNGMCANPYCMIELVKYHVDHVIALARGGSNFPSNLQLLCRECNMRKSVKTMAEFLAREGRRVSRLGN